MRDETTTETESGEEDKEGVVKKMKRMKKTKYEAKYAFNAAQSIG